MRVQLCQVMARGETIAPGKPAAWGTPVWGWAGKRGACGQGMPHGSADGPAIPQDVHEEPRFSPPGA